MTYITGNTQLLELIKKALLNERKNHQIQPKARMVDICCIKDISGRDNTKNKKSLPLW